MDERRKISRALIDSDQMYIRLEIEISTRDSRDAVE